MVNGFRIEETNFSKTSTECPTNLSQNLILQKGWFFVGTFWNQVRSTVANLNVFSGIMPMEGMVARTSGKDCGKQDGDFLSWKMSSWSLQGAAKWTDVSVEDLCRTESSIHLFSTQAVEKPDDCKYLCSKVHKESQMASAETPKLFEKLKDRMDMISSSSSRLAKMGVWLPMRIENNTLVDSYNTANKIPKPHVWNQGFPIDSENMPCMATNAGLEGYNNLPCLVKDEMYCSCQFTEERPILSLRGLCKDSHIDQIYMPHNNPLDGELAYYGNSKTRAIFLDGENQWGLEIRVELKK